MKNLEKQFDEWWDNHLIKIGGGIERGIAYQDTKQFIKSLLKAQREEMIEIVEKYKKQYHGGGNGRRLFIQLLGELKNL